METIVSQLPKTEFEAFQKLVKKMENRIPYIKVQFREFYKKMYRHAERDVEGFMAVTKCGTKLLTLQLKWILSMTGCC